MFLAKEFVLYGFAFLQMLRIFNVRKKNSDAAIICAVLTIIAYLVSTLLKTYTNDETWSMLKTLGI